MLEEGLQGVTNENTLLALTHRYLGVDISLAQKYLLKAAYEDDDDLAKFLIIYSIESGGGFGFEAGELNYKMLNQLVESEYVPAIMYYNMGIIFQLEEMKIPFFFKIMNWVKWRDDPDRSGREWLARFGDANNQAQIAWFYGQRGKRKEEHKWYKKAAQQNNQSGLSKMRDYYYYTQKRNMYKVLDYTKHPRDIVMYKRFGETDDEHIIYDVGKLFKNKISSVFMPAGYFCSWDPRSHVQFYDRVVSNCQYATCYWIWIAKQHRVVKDVYLIIAKDVWESRLSEPGIWNFESTCTRVEQPGWFQSGLVKLAMFLRGFASDMIQDE